MIIINLECRHALYANVGSNTLGTMENFQFDILEELLLRYGATETDLSRFTDEKLKVSPTDLVKTRHVRDALSDLETRGLITWKVDKRTSKNGEPPTFHWDNPQYKVDFGKNINGEDQSFGNNRVEGRLTATGLDYAISIVRGKQIHESTLSTNKYMTWFTGAVLFATFVTLGLQAYDFFKPDPEIRWDKLIESQKVLVDSIGTDLKKINSNIEKLTQDSAKQKVKPK